MDIKPDKKTAKRILAIAFTIIAMFLLLQNFPKVWAVFTRVFSPAIIALVAAFIINLVMKPLEEKVFTFAKCKLKRAAGLRRALCLTLSLLIFFGAVTLLLFIIIPEIGGSIKDVVARLPEYAERLMAWAARTGASLGLDTSSLDGAEIDWDGVMNSITGWLKGSSDSLFSAATDATFSIFGGVFNVAVGIILAVYLLAGKEKALTFTDNCLRAFLDNSAYQKVADVARLANDTLAGFISGQCIEAMIFGVLCYIGMLIFGFPYPQIISVTLAVTALLPIIGAWIGGAVGGFLILTVDPILAIWFVVFIIILQQLEGNLIYPRVVGKKVGLPGVLVLFSVIVGGNIGGVMGALVGVPLCSVVYVLLRDSSLERLKNR